MMKQTEFSVFLIQKYHFFTFQSGKLKKSSPTCQPYMSPLFIDKVLKERNSGALR